MRTVFSYENEMCDKKLWDIGMKNTQSEGLSDLDLKNLGSLIRSKRKEKELTQQEVAEMVGLCVQHYSRIERGEYIPSLQTFLRLVEFFKIDISGVNVNKGGSVTSTMYEIISLLEKFNITQQKAVLSFLKTMGTPA